MKVEEKVQLKASRLYLQKFSERKQPSKNIFCNIETKLRKTCKVFNLFKYTFYKCKCTYLILK
jgi:hypothetical protein